MRVLRRAIDVWKIYRLTLAGAVVAYLSYGSVKDVSANELLLDHFGIGGTYGIGSGLIFILVLVFVVGVLIYINRGRGRSTNALPTTRAQPTNRRDTPGSSVDGQSKEE